MNKQDLRYSAADFRARAGVQMARRIPQNSPEDPLQSALRTSREMAADRVIRRSVAETEAEEIKAQADALEQKLRLQNIEGQLKGQGGNEFLGQLMDEVKELREQIATQREAMTQQQLDELRGTLTATMEELNNLRGGRVSTVQTIKDQVQEAKELVSLLTPAEPVLPAGAEDRALTAFMLRSKLEEKQLDLKAQQMGWEREDRLAIAHEELELKKQIAEEELRQKQSHYDQQDRFLTDTVPKILPLIEKIATTISSKSGNAAPQASPMVLPSPLPEGVEAASCQVCGSVIYYRKGMTRVICPNPQCLTEYELRDDNDGTVEPPEPSQQE